MLASHSFQIHAFQTGDPRLVPIKDKVLAGERLNEADALALYGTGDILALGWLANWVRERMHARRRQRQHSNSAEARKRKSGH